MNCIIIEDEPLAREVVREFVEDYPGLELEAEFGKAQEAISWLQQHQTDLIFLDINLPKLSGISLYRSLQNRPQVIFTTAYPEHALEGFELDATDYLLKPISYERFLTAVNKAFKRSAQKIEEPEFLNIKADKRTYRVKLEDIKYFESIGDYLKVYTEQQVIICNLKLKDLENMLADTQFIRIHKTYMVAASRISFMEGNTIQLEEQKLPVGKVYRDKVKSLF